MFRNALFLFAICCSVSADEKPKVLIIGDSISLGYTPHLITIMQPTVDVRHHKGNAQHTGTGLQKIDKWLGDTDWDVIHFNWGLWDLCYRHPKSKVQGHRDKVNGTLTTSLQQYEENLETLVRRLKQTNAKLIWGNITIVPEGEAGRKRNDDLKYNEVAARVMKKYDIPINDLNKRTRRFPPELFTKPGDVHFTSEGYQQLAHQVAAAIQTALTNDKQQATFQIKDVDGNVRLQQKINLNGTDVAADVTSRRNRESLDKNRADHPACGY